VNRTALVIAAILAAVASPVNCLPAQSQQPQPPLALPDAGDDCAKACAVLAALHCPEAAPTQLGEECVPFCRRMNAALPGSLNAACIAHAPDLPTVRGCRVHCAQ
jgi:hypothetical protein